LRINSINRALYGHLYLRSMKTITQLIKEADCDTGKAIDHVGFSAETHPYSINFYTDNGNVFSEIAQKIKGKWVEVQASPEEIKLMENRIETHITEIEDNEKRSFSQPDPIEYRDGDTFSYNG